MMLSIRSRKQKTKLSMEAADVPTTQGSSYWVSQMKTLLITFFNIDGIVHFEFILQGQTADQAYYVEILKRLHEALRRKRPELWPKD